jgi:acyl-CoA reductase-like NAD-dependent aldehyde dehydrogenase
VTDASTASLLAALSAARPIGAPDPAALSRAVADDLCRERRSILDAAGAALPFSEADNSALFDDTIAYLNGFPTLVASANASIAARTAQLAAVDPGASVVARPHGRVLLVIPANAPLPLAIILPLSFVAAGNHVAVAASSGARTLALRLAGLVRRHVPDRMEIWPHGVQAAVDATLSAEVIDLLYFMGSSALRASVYGRAAEAGVTVIYEGQGLGVAIVDGRLSDERLAHAAQAVALSKTRWGGQMCSAPNAVLVERADLRRFSDAFDAAAAKMPLSASLSEVLDQDVGVGIASLPGGASLLSRRAAALVEVDDLAAAAKTEIFGPSAYLVCYDDAEAALRTIDNLRHRLQLSVFSDDPGFVERAISATRLARYTVNRVPSVQNPLLPWGNFGKSGTSWVLNFFEKARVEAIVEQDAVPTPVRPAVSAVIPSCRTLENRIFLWAHPRSRSTAFERAFIERNDCVVLHEPLSKYRYFDGDVVRLVAAIGDDACFIGDPVLDDVRFVPDDNPRYGFVKDFPYHAAAWLSDSLLRRFRHIFLVRSPAEAILSFQMAHPDFLEEETGYHELLGLARRVSDGLGEEILIVEADDFACNPEAVLKRSCAFAGIPFDARMLTWTRREEIPAWGLWKRFHESTLKSVTISRATGLASVVPLPENRLRLVAALEPVYRDILALGEVVRGGDREGLSDDQR